MLGIRHSVSNFTDKVVQQQLINKDLQRSASKKIIFFSKPLLQRKSFIRHKSSFINQIPKRKFIFNIIISYIFIIFIVIIFI